MELFVIGEDKVKQMYFQNPEFGFFLIQLILKRFIKDRDNLQNK